MGASLAATPEREPVIGLCGSWAGDARARPWQQDRIATACATAGATACATGKSTAAPAANRQLSGLVCSPPAAQAVVWQPGTSPGHVLLRRDIRVGEMVWRIAPGLPGQLSARKPAEPPVDGGGAQLGRADAMNRIAGSAAGGVRAGMLMAGAWQGLAA